MISLTWLYAALLALALAGCSSGPPQAPIGLNKVPANPAPATPAE